jgi:hypothetical protein
MQPRTYPPLIEAFLIVEQPRQRLSHWLTTLAPLDSDHAPPLAAITGYWDPTTDQALVALKYDEAALGSDRLKYVVDLALLAEIGMIQPSELGEGDRRRFVAERLARCTIEVAGPRTVTAILTELARRIREQKKPFVPPRGDTEDPVMLVKAKGTRDDLDRDDVVRATAKTRLDKPVDRPTAEVPPIELQKMVRATAAAVTPAGPMIAPTDSGAIPRQVARGATSKAVVDRSTPVTHGPMPPGIIYARYLRSGRWVPVRIGALSLRGAALMTGALPRIQDHVDIALSFGDHRALVRGPVSKVSSLQEAQMSGAATFSVTFDLDDASRRQLTSLLTAARAANVVIKPPPPRQNRRFPVEWPVCLGSSRGAMRANALDVSAGGMYVRPQNPLSLDDRMTFSAVLDDGGAPVSGRAKVVRHITDAEARTCGLIPGWGLQIVDMGDDDRERWSAFIARVEKRSDKRILVGASPSRLAELQAGLAAVGYAVTGGTDAGALVQLASADSRPVDAAIIDGGWLTPGTPVQWVESLFAARGVPCVTLHDADGRRARTTIDKLLAVL